MRMGGELGQLKEGFLADLLLVDGNPLDDLSILVGPQRLAMIMKDGQMHKDPASHEPVAQQVAAE
jgi:imidazolonepropionase-like amidohydrolase